MFDFRADFTPHSVFSASNNAIDYLRGDELAKRTQLIQAEEEKFMKDRAAVTKKAACLKGEERTKFLHDYNKKSCDHVLKIVQAENARLMPNKVKILADVVKVDGRRYAYDVFLAWDLPAVLEAAREFAEGRDDVLELGFHSLWREAGGLSIRKPEKA